MKIKEAVKWMEEAIQETTEYFEQCSPTLQEELIKQKEVFELALTALRSMPETTKSGWISVKERLPSIRDDGIAECYLISDGNLIHMAYYVTGEWRFCESGQITEPMFYEVTHWMPLPEPPEEG